LEAWALAEIYFKAFPDHYVAWLVSRAKNHNHKFLAYLLVYTQNQGEEAIEKLMNTYKDLRGIPLEFELGGSWEDLFSNKVPEYYNGQFEKVSER
jgi:hypothetical protein